jgi:15-cis-phytoene synthase
MIRSDIAACRALLRSGSRTFYMASFLLPGQFRNSASALYAFCRCADDAVDVQGGRLEAIADLRQRLDLAYRGSPRPTPIDRAFAATIQEYAIPKELPEGLIAGLEWDAKSYRYETLEDLQSYAVRVAGTVGAMMALLMRISSPTLVARACDLGIAMQLTNIARDVGEDARMGRLYLPISWMREADIDPDRWLSHPTFSSNLASVIARFLASADTFYKRADPAIDALPISCRPGIAAARLLYAEIGNELERRGFDSVSQRVSVSTGRKLELCSDAVARLRSRRTIIATENTDAAAFVVRAVAEHETALEASRRLDWWDIRGRALRLLDILERVERRERIERGAVLKRAAIA